MASKRSPKPPVRVRDDRAITTSDAPSSPRELIVIAAAGVELRASGADVTSAVGADVSTLAELIGKENISLEPLFGLPEERMRAATESLKGAVGADALPDMSLYYRVVAPDERLDDLAERFRKDPNIEAAYVKPGAELEQIDDMVPLAAEAPLATPDFTSRQGYLNAAPGGIDARYAWTRPGGGGLGVRIIDIEGAWRLSHEDLVVNQGGVIAGIQTTDPYSINHGTAVVGEISGDRNAFGTTGIAPDANIRAVSMFGVNGTAGAIRFAADHLSPGDIILLEMQRGGPNAELIPIEWWPDDLAAIQYATVRGVIVVEVAGNGAQNLDDPRYDRPFSSFPSTWRNPFRRNSVNSGAIVVGAGAPPSGHFGPDRSRLDFSNYGSMIDAQGWGREIVTTGFGDLQGGSNKDLWYTARFDGTSGASAIVVGAIACVQGARRAAGLPLRTPVEMRNGLRTTGTAQQASSIAPLSQRIGNRPNLRQLLNLKTEKEKEKEREKDKEVIKDLRDTDNFGVRSTLKNRTKDVRDSFKVREGIGSAPAGNVEDRVAALEESVQQLAHFITAELRPDLTTSSLSGEVGDPDAAALSEELRRQAVDAKTLKDDKDLEKTRDR